MDAPKWPLDPSKKDGVVLETQRPQPAPDPSSDSGPGSTASATPSAFSGSSAGTTEHATGSSQPSTAMGPPPGATEHDGVAIPSDAVFFAPAPEAIGRVLSASSNLKKGQRPMSSNTRIVVTLVGFLLGLGLGLGINWIFDVVMGFWRTLWPTAFGAVGALIAWLATGFSHTCTYVGDLGIAKFTCKGTPENVTGKEILLFKDVDQLRTTITRHYTNGVYSNTSYNFLWTDKSRGYTHMVSGTYRKKDGAPPSGDHFHYAEAAETAWTVHLLEQSQQALDEKGAIQFDLHKGDHVRIGRGYIELTFKGKTALCDVEDIETISIAQGFFTIKRKDAKVGWFRKDGVFQFSYATMANARLFVLALDRILGFRFGAPAQDS